jgi:HD-GYP domain-containing protein (c-di-GMP phosphodiesterase class II)
MHQGQWAVNQLDWVQVSLDDLCLGAICKFDIRDQQGLLLLGKGLPLTQTILDQVLNRGISFLEVHPSDVDALTGRIATQKAGKRPERKQSERSHKSLFSKRVDRSREPYSSVRAERFAKQVVAAVGVLAQIGEQIQSLTQPVVSELCDIPAQMTDMLLEDPDQSIFAVGDSDDQRLLPQRCARMSLLAINTGIEMELSDKEVMQLGTAALLHDLGLYLMPAHFRDPTIELTANEVWEYKRHPSLVVNAFAKLSIVSDEVRVIANQVHERLDGSGYPRGLHGNLIHPLASVLGLVDSYLTLIQPGPDRPAVVPHDAIGYLLFEVGRGLFDAAAMRAFLNQIAFFPIGSKVELDNGQRATVIRRDGNHYTTPIVRIDGAHATDGLSLRVSARNIARPVVDEPGRQMRITKSMMPTLSMDMFQPAS